MFFKKQDKREVHVSKPFIWRAAHSFTGLIFTFFLCEHIFVNFLASSFLSKGHFFVAMVNSFHRLPGLKVIEICGLTIPFAIHAIIGIVYALQGKANNFPNSGDKPHCNYVRNHFYFLQRLTAWLLLVGILVHVVHMRFIAYPESVEIGTQTYYAVKVQQKAFHKITRNTQGFLIYHKTNKLFVAPEVSSDYLSVKIKNHLTTKHMYILAPNFGTSFLYIVRNSFQNLWFVLLYACLVIAAAFHGFNGLWTFCSRWGVVLSHRQQNILQVLCLIIMSSITFMGLSVLWNLYWVS